MSDGQTSMRWLKAASALGSVLVVLGSIWFMLLFIARLDDGEVEFHWAMVEDTLVGLLLALGGFAIAISRHRSGISWRRSLVHGGILATLIWFVVAVFLIGWHCNQIVVRGGPR